MIDQCYFSPDPATPGCFTPLGAIKLTVDVAQFKLVFDQIGPLSYAYVIDRPGQQLLDLSPGIDDLTGMSDLFLVGSTGAFINGTDYMTLHSGRVIAAESKVPGGVREEIFANIQLTSVQVNGVPEPSGGVMIVLGTAMLVAARSRRANRV